MNDKELADRVVALGVGKANQIYPDGIGKFYQVDVDADWQTSVNESKFVRDWRVAGAMMERCRNIHIYWDDIDFSVVAHGPFVTGKTTGKGEVDALSKNFYPLPRAIIEACCEALYD